MDEAGSPTEESGELVPPTSGPQASTPAPIPDLLSGSSPPAGPLAAPAPLSIDSPDRPYRASDGTSWSGPVPPRPAFPPVGEVTNGPVGLPVSPTGPMPALPASRRSNGMGKWVTVAVVAAVVGGAVGAATAEVVGTGTRTVVTTAPAQGTVPPGPAQAAGSSIPAIVQKDLPEVVAIDAQGPSGSGTFGGGGIQEAQGTGMIYSAGGLVVTNNHVISGATRITVTRYGETKVLGATVVGVDPADDVALLQIMAPPADLKAVAFGDSTKLQVGDSVIAIGNALGLSAGTPTVTSGIVSALGRTVQAGDSSGAGTTETLTNMIQTDAAINPGNSGGALLDSAGDVIGMNTATATSGTGNTSAQNIGFAIPAASIEALIPKLKAGTIGPSTAYMGVYVEDVTAQLRQAYSLVPPSGALVYVVQAGSPAQAAGLEAGDVVVSYDGSPVTKAQELTTAVHTSTPGHVAQLVVWRGSRKLSVSVTLSAPPAP